MPIPSQIKLPDLLSLYPYTWKTNPLLDQVEKQSTDWVLSYGGFDDEVRKGIIRARAPLLGGHVYTNAGLDALRTCCDFLNLTFTIDEITDVQDVVGARATRDAIVNALNGIYDESSTVSKLTRE